MDFCKELGFLRAKCLLRVDISSVEESLFPVEGFSRSASKTFDSRL
jgi:hypothetical protein